MVLEIGIAVHFKDTRSELLKAEFIYADMQGVLHVGILCSNEWTSVYFGFDWYFMLSLFVWKFE